MRRAFTMIELVMVLGIVTLASVFVIPAYRRHQIRTDLSTASEQIVQALGRAQILSQTGEGGASWGFHVAAGTLYRGVSYADRDPSFDELYSFPGTIATSGLPEVRFSPLDGRPNATGSIVLQAMTGEQRTIDITINTQGIATNISDDVTICHKPGTPACRTMTVSDNQWFGNGGHRRHGDTLGPCTACPGEESEEDDD